MCTYMAKNIDNEFKLKTSCNKTTQFKSTITLPYLFIFSQKHCMYSFQ